MVGSTQLIQAAALKYTLVGQPFDLGRRHAKQLTIDVLVVLAVAGRAAVDAPAGVGRALRQLRRYLGDRPTADLAARHLGQPSQCPELRINIAALLGRLADSSRHAGLLQR